MLRKTLIAGSIAVAIAGVGSTIVAPAAFAANGSTTTKTPIKHVIVIYQENVSFDHYFATYPNAKNPAGEPKFVARKGTPQVNGLNETLLTRNPNSSQPQRLGRDEALTCDQDHHYGDEQAAMNGGLMDKFVEETNRESCTSPQFYKPGLVMDYYDGNTVTALWNYAQYFSMSDNSQYVKQAIEAGARGYITKDEISEDIVKAIRQALKGQIYLSSRLLKNMPKGELDGLLAEKV